MAGSESRSFALASDIHIAADSSRVSRNVNMSAHLQQMGEALAKAARRPSLLLISGDLALDSGQSGDYEQVTRLLEPVRQAGIDVCLALGNHDNRENFRKTVGGAANVHGLEHHVAFLPTPGVNWIVLDSLEKTLSTPGLLGRAQLQWLELTLDANPRKPTMVMVHHNPGTVNSIAGLKDTDALLAVLRPRNQVKALFYGHTHTWSAAEDTSGLWMINLPPVAYVFRPTDPSGWIEARMGTNNMRLQFHGLGPQHAVHGQALELGWRA
jgi:3',5'-cyclic AMP phosphodiesterase CpdA